MTEKQVSFSRRIESLDNNSKIPPVMREVLKEISALGARLDAQGIKLSVAIDFGMRKDGHVERLGETSEKACASLFAAAFSMQAVLVDMDGEIQQ